VHAVNISDLLNAVETVLTWELPEDAFADAVNAQLPVMIGSDPADRSEAALA
jgi:hypothetical protein